MDAGLLDVLHHAADDDVALRVGQRVHVELEGVLEEAVDQDRPLGRGVDRVDHVALERGRIVDDRHRAPAEHVGRPHHHRVADAARDLERLVLRHRHAVLRLRDLQLVQERREALAILGEVDRVGRGADDGDAGFLQRQRQLQRRLAAELHHDRDLAAGRALGVEDRHHVLEGQRLEEQPIDRVVVGRDRLRVAVDHHRLVAGVAQGEGGVTAAVVELDALPDAVRSAAEDDHLLPRRRRRLALLVVAAVEVGRERLELGGAGVDALVGRRDRGGAAARPDLALAAAGEAREIAVGEALALEVAQALGRQRVLALRLHLVGHRLDLGELGQEPRVDLGQLVDLRHGPAALEGAEQRPHAAIVRDHEQALEGRELLVGLVLRLAEQRRAAPELERADALQERLLEGAADRHRLADRLHLRRQRLVGLRELLEREARDLDDDVVDGRLERRRRDPRDVVRDLVEAVAERELGGDLGDREAGCLRGEGRRARHARVHLDDDQAAVFGVDRELDVGAAGLDADAADDAPRRVAHALVFLVGQRERRRDGDAVAGVDAHRVDVLDRADDDEVVLDVAHHLELEFLPPDHRLLDQHFVDRREAQAAAGDLAELLDVVGDAAADAAHGERRADDRRKAGARHRGHRLVERLHHRRRRRVDADLGHRLAEQLPVFRDLDRLDRGADQLHAVLGEDAVLLELDGEVERRLAADRRQHRVGPLALDDLGHDVHRERLDVGPVGQLRVGHDRRRVGVDQHDLEPLGAQRLAGLSAGVVELARLADDDGPGADDEDAVDVGALGHEQLHELLVREHPGRPTRGIIPGWFNHPGMVVTAHFCLSIASRKWPKR